jgi:hypothetical protein
MTMNKVLLYALANVDNERYGHEGGYAIIHGSQLVPDLPCASKSFDALAVAYPALWPYRCRLFHNDHCQKLSLFDGCCIIMTNDFNYTIHFHLLLLAFSKSSRLFFLLRSICADKILKPTLTFWPISPFKTYRKLKRMKKIIVQFEINMYSAYNIIYM